MGSKRKIQINNKRNKKNKKTRKQKGGFGLNLIPGANLAMLQMRLMKAQMNLQVAFLSQDPKNMDPKKACDLAKTTMTEINDIMSLMSKEPGMDIIINFLKEPVDKITAIVKDPKCPDRIMEEIKGIVKPMVDDIAGKISAALPGILKTALKGGKEAFKTFLSAPPGSALGLPIKANEVDAFYDNDFIQKVLADTPAPEASEDSGDSGAASTGDSGAASTGDSGAASTGKTELDTMDPKEFREKMDEKLEKHKNNPERLAHYKEWDKKFKEKNKGGGGTKRNKKNNKRKTIKIKCL